MEIIYRAFDGTEFENEADCTCYELANDPKEFVNNILALDYDGNKISPLEADRTFYININGEEMSEKYYKYCDSCGCKAPVGEGMWMYVDDEWVRWEDEMDKASGRVKELDNIYSKMTF